MTPSTAAGRPGEKDAFAVVPYSACMGEVGLRELRYFIAVVKEVSSYWDREQ
jgi:hypothetical protein